MKNNVMTTALVAVISFASLTAYADTAICPAASDLSSKSCPANDKACVLTNDNDLLTGNGMDVRKYSLKLQSQQTHLYLPPVRMITCNYSLTTNNDIVASVLGCCSGNCESKSDLVACTRNPTN